MKCRELRILPGTKFRLPGTLNYSAPLLLTPVQCTGSLDLFIFQKFKDANKLSDWLQVSVEAFLTGKGDGV